MLMKSRKMTLLLVALLVVGGLGYATIDIDAEDRIVSIPVIPNRFEIPNALKRVGNVFFERRNKVSGVFIGYDGDSWQDLSGRGNLSVERHEEGPIEAKPNIHYTLMPAEDIDFNLPPAKKSEGAQITIKLINNSGDKRISLMPSPNETIDGKDSFIMNTHLDALLLFSDGTQWVTFRGLIPKNIVSNDFAIPKTATNKTYYIVKTEGDKAVINLPNPSLNRGSKFSIKIAAKNASVRVNTQFGESIDGNSSVTFSTLNESATILCDGTSWFVTQHQKPFNHAYISQEISVTTSTRLVTPDWEDVADSSISLTPGRWRIGYAVNVRISNVSFAGALEGAGASVAIFNESGAMVPLTGSLVISDFANNSNDDDQIQSPSRQTVIEVSEATTLSLRFADSVELSLKSHPF